MRLLERFEADRAADEFLSFKPTRLSPSDDLHPDANLPR